MSHKRENYDDSPNSGNSRGPGNKINPLWTDRRSCLKFVGATAALATSAIPTVSAGSEDYEIIEVGPGETFTKSLDDGETWENVLIDITAQGAGYYIDARANNFEIRNIGVRGKWDHEPSTSPFRALCSDPNATGVIENVYIGDGTDFNQYDLSIGNPTGIFVGPNHAGDLLIKGVNIQEMADNAIYASAPGNSADHPRPGQGGTVRVENGFFWKNGPAADIRLGTDGSYAKNCGAYHGYRSTRTPYNHVEFIDCHFYNPGDTPGGTEIDIGTSSWNGGTDAEVTVTNTYFNNDRVSMSHGSNELHGGPAGEPEIHGPDYFSAPVSAEDAASGNVGSPPDEGDEEDEEKNIEDVWLDDDPNHIIFSGGYGDISEYQLEGLGIAEYGDSANTRDDDPYRDTIKANGDEYVIEGYLGGGADDFHVHGKVTSVDADDGVTLTVNDVEFDPIELEGIGSWESEEEDEEKNIEDVWLDDDPNHIIFSGGYGDVSKYQLEGLGVAEYGESANTRDDDPYRDTIKADGDEYVIEGYLGGGADDFHVHGKVTSVDADDGVTLTVNDVDFDPVELEGIGSWESEEDDELHTLEVAGQFEYRVEVSGEIEPAEGYAEWVEEGSAYGDDWAEWWLSGSDSAQTVWEFTGEITALEIDDYNGETDVRTLEVNGQELDHNKFIDGQNSLEVAGQFEYRVEVSGEIEPAEGHAEWVEEGSAYGDDWAEWWLSGSDSAQTVWEFTGEITALEIDDYSGEIDVRTLAVNGEEIDYKDYL